MTAKATILIGMLLSITSALQAQVEAHEEPKHRPVLENGDIRILDVWIKGGDSCKYHVHRTPSLFLYLSSTQIRTQVQGASAIDQKVEPGQTWYNGFDKPLIHKAWVRDAGSLHAMDIELLGPMPHGGSSVLEASGLTLVQDSSRYRTYRVDLPPGTRLQLPLRGNPALLIPYRGDGRSTIDGQDNDLYQGQYQWVEKGKMLEWRNIGQGRMEGYLYEIKQ
jgi:hypothetical protein